MSGGSMDQGVGALASGKGAGDENFPVASWLVRRSARAPVMAFYHFARAADDVADNPGAPANEKLRLLAALRLGLTGDPAGAPEARALAAVADPLGLDLVHARDLLDAFEQDVAKNRYADWGELVGYCALSAMPVGRFVLEVHGEDRGLWPMSDALCGALQIVNHLQDCGKDYRALDRVYIPEPLLTAAGLDVTVLAGAQSPPELLAVIRNLAWQTWALLATSAPLSGAIRDPRLAAEVAVIQRLAEDLVALLLVRDPLAGGVHHTRRRAARIAAGAVARLAWGRITGRGGKR